MGREWEGVGVRGGEGRNAPALIRTNKGTMTALRPLVPNDAMQAIALERARGARIDRLASTIPPRVDKAAVDRLAGPRELQGAGRHAIVADERLVRLRLEPRRAPHVGRDKLAGGLGRERGVPCRLGAGAPALRE